MHSRNEMGNPIVILIVYTWTIEKQIFFKLIKLCNDKVI